MELAGETSCASSESSLKHTYQKTAGAAYVGWLRCNVIGFCSKFVAAWYL